MNTEEDSEYSKYERLVMAKRNMKLEDKQNALKVQTILDDHFDLLNSNQLHEIYHKTKGLN